MEAQQSAPLQRELLDACNLTCKLCWSMARLATCRQLPPAHAQFAAVLRAGAALLTLHPRLIQAALASPDFRAAHAAGPASASWLQLLTDHLCWTTHTTCALAAAASHALDSEADVATVAPLPTALFVWLELASDAVAGVMECAGKLRQSAGLASCRHTQSIVRWCPQD